MIVKMNYQHKNIYVIIIFYLCLPITSYHQYYELLISPLFLISLKVSTPFGCSSIIFPFFNPDCLMSFKGLSHVFLQLQETTNRTPILYFIWIDLQDNNYGDKIIGVREPNQLNSTFNNHKFTNKLQRKSTYLLSRRTKFLQRLQLQRHKLKWRLSISPHPPPQRNAEWYRFWDIYL